MGYRRRFQQGNCGRNDGALLSEAESQGAANPQIGFGSARPLGPTALANGSALAAPSRATGSLAAVLLLGRPSEFPFPGRSTRRANAPVQASETKANLLPIHKVGDLRFGSGADRKLRRGRLKPQDAPLLGPKQRQVDKPRPVEAARQTSLDRRLGQIRCEKSERRC
jgi:hypothetical protein